MAINFVKEHLYRVIESDINSYRSYLDKMRETNNCVIPISFSEFSGYSVTLFEDGTRIIKQVHA